MLYKETCFLTTLFLQHIESKKKISRIEHMEVHIIIFRTPLQTEGTDRLNDELCYTAEFKTTDIP